MMAIFFWGGDFTLAKNILYLWAFVPSCIWGYLIYIYIIFLWPGIIPILLENTKLLLLWICNYKVSTPCAIWRRLLNAELWRSFFAVATQTLSPI